MRASEFITEAAKPTDQDTIDLVKMAWDSGKQPKAISADLGLPIKVVNHLLSREHTSRQEKRLHLSRALTDDDKNIIVSRFLNNDTVKNISQEYGVSVNVTTKILKSKLGLDGFTAELEKRKATPTAHINNKITPEMLVKMRELYANGKTLVDIANYFDIKIHHKSVVNAMRRQPDYEELRAKRDEKTRKVKHEPVATTKIHRPGVIGTQSHKGPGTIHTHGVSWPKYG